MVTKSPVKCYHIDAIKGEIVEAESSGLADLQRMVGGLITVAHCYDNGDILFVDDEGLFKGYKHAFALRHSHQPMFVGNGVLVGQETAAGKQLEPKTTLDELKHNAKLLELHEGTQRWHIRPEG